jgi:hypothetical protein
MVLQPDKKFHHILDSNFTRDRNFIYPEPDEFSRSPPILVLEDLFSYTSIRALDIHMISKTWNRRKNYDISEQE